MVALPMMGIKRHSVSGTDQEEDGGCRSKVSERNVEAALRWLLGGRVAERQRILLNLPLTFFFGYIAMASDV